MAGFFSKLMGKAGSEDVYKRQLLYLAGAGAGQIVVVDDDFVDASNLHRQVIHTHARVGNSKAESAAESLRSLNPFIEVVPVRERLTEANRCV